MLKFMRLLEKLLQYIFKDSSETIREATFNFSDFNIKYNMDNSINIEFLIWFVGYSEGKNCFLTDTSTDLQTFSLIDSDAKILLYIKKNLGFGSVKKVSINNDSVYLYKVSDIKSIIKLMYIFNGNLQLETSFNSFLNWLKNTKSLALKGNFVIKSREKKISLNNPWLSGFINSKGRFIASLLKDEKISLTYLLITKFKIENIFDRDGLVNIYTVLVSESGRINSNDYIISGSFSFLLNYLKNYPLVGKKNEIFKRWVRLYPYRVPLTLNILSKNRKAFLKLQNSIDFINKDESSKY
jgi:hypothetical protein